MNVSIALPDITPMPDGPIVSPAAWRRSHMEADNSW